MRPVWPLAVTHDKMGITTPKFCWKTQSSSASFHMSRECSHVVLCLMNKHLPHVSGFLRKHPSMVSVSRPVQFCLARSCGYIKGSLCNPDLLWPSLVVILRLLSPCWAGVAKCPNILNPKCGHPQKRQRHNICNLIYCTAEQYDMQRCWVSWSCPYQGHMLLCYF